MRRNVLLSGKPRQALPIHVNPQWIHPTQEHVNSQIELQSFDKKWPMEVALNHKMVVGIYIVKISGKEYPSTLARSLRLYYKSSVHLVLVFILASVGGVF